MCTSSNMIQLGIHHTHYGSNSVCQCGGVQVYSNDVNNIDVMVGLLSEHPLPGFIFGEAIYTIFVLQVRTTDGDNYSNVADVR